MAELPEGSSPDPNASIGAWRSIGRRIASLCGLCARPCVRFCRLAWPGAAVGLIVAALFFPAYGGLCMGTGLGAVVDVAGSLLLGAVILTLATLLVLLGLVFAKRMPLRFKALVVIAFASLFAVAGPFGLSPDFVLHLGGPLVLLPMLAGASVAILRQRRSRRAGLVSCIIASLMLIGVISAGAVLIYWLAVPGDDPFFKDIRAATDKQTPGLDVPDPSQAGRYEVATLFYGSGTDRRRPEYAEKVDLTTDPVDASAFLTNLSGFKAWARRKYWGFEPKNFPLNARAWCPKGEGPFPLVLIVHGNHKMEEFSDPGYAYLGALLASRGFILASIDENFLNSNWAGDIGGENHVRGWLLLQHFLARGALLSGDDQRRIAKVYLAAFLEATLRDRSEYIPMFRDHRCAAPWLPDTVYFNRFADSHLRIVSDFDESIDVTKTAIEGGSQTASHLGLWRHRRLEGRSGWSFQDRAALLGWNTGSGPRPAPEDAPSYTITLPDGTADRWRIDGHTILSFCLADTCETCEAPKDDKPARAPEPNAPTNPEPNVPDPAPGKPPLDLTIELAASDGSVASLPLSHICPLQPILKVTFTKWPYGERIRFKSSSEPVLQTYEIPLSDFVEANPKFDPGLLRQIRLRFDRTRTAVILLDDVGLAADLLNQ
ncbi:MAG: hypothetical protein NTZ17_06865 [Phycisphaerae bacterium]|nr:hypothetical protein [Phycisphaerae bacterium]